MAYSPNPDAIQQWIRDIAAALQNSAAGTTALTVTGGGGGGGGTQYAELNTTAPATGTVTLGRYQSSAPTLTNGQLYAPQLDALGRLLVNVAAGGTSGTQYQELATTSPATGNLVLGRYQTTLPTLTNGQMNEPMVDASSRVIISGTSALDTTTVPPGSVIVGGESNDGTPQYNPIPLGAAGRSVIVEGFSGGTAVPVTGGGVSVVDEASWTAGTSTFSPGGGFFNDSAAALTSGQQGTVRMSPDRAFSTYNSYPASVTATWTTSTTINTASAVSTIGQGTVTVTTVETGTTTTAGVLTFEVYDGTNWWAVEGQQIGGYTIQSNYTLVNGTNVAWQFDVGGFQQFRTRLSTAITGTGSPQVVIITQATGSASENTPTVGLGQKLDNVNDSITNYAFGHTYTHISTATTTTIKSGAGVLRLINVGSLGTVASTCTIYDNTAGSGTVIGIINTLNLSGPFQYDVAFSTGLTIVTTGTVAPDITVSSR